MKNGVRRGAIVLAIGLTVAACDPVAYRAEQKAKRADAALGRVHVLLDEFKQCMTLPDGTYRPAVQDMSHPCAETMRKLDWAQEAADFERDLANDE